MSSDVTVVTIKGVMPTSNGCAIFLGNDEKTFVIYVDQSIGQALSMALNDVNKERPLTHDLIGTLFVGFGIELQHILINDVSEGTFFARILLKMANEVDQKIVELDARPSDSLVLAIQARKPIYVARTVLDNVDDMSEILERILKQQND